MICDLSKNECKRLTALKIKKYRLKEQLFIVEGEKMVEEALRAGRVQAIIATNDWWGESKNISDGIKCYKAGEDQIRKMSEMITPPSVMAVVRIPSYQFSLQDLKGNVSLALDNIQDPGNMGTMLRLSDWFGIKNILCSTGCVDIWNSKVIQASMGSIFRVHVYYARLEDIFDRVSRINLPVIGALLSGDNLYTTTFPKEGILLLGNESKGISTELLPYINKKITIPFIDKPEGHAESLNVAVAASIICSEWMRKLYWS